VSEYNRPDPTKYAKLGDSRLFSLDQLLFENGNASARRAQILRAPVIATHPPDFCAFIRSAVPDTVPSQRPAHTPNLRFRLEEQLDWLFVSGNGTQTSRLSKRSIESGGGGVLKMPTAVDRA
jgi:hypothetical protein